MQRPAPKTMPPQRYNMVVSSRASDEVKCAHGPLASSTLARIGRVCLIIENPLVCTETLPPPPVMPTRPLVCTNAYLFGKLLLELGSKRLAHG